MIKPTSNIKRKEMVLYCLEQYPSTRNCDVTLTTTIWQEFYESQFSKLKEFLSKLYTEKDSPYTLGQILTGFMKSVPNEDDIKRIRAFIQNEDGLFLPTDPEVIKQRKVKQLNWRETAL